MPFTAAERNSPYLHIRTSVLVNVPRHARAERKTDQVSPPDRKGRNQPCAMQASGASRFLRGGHLTSYPPRAEERSTCRTTELTTSFEFSDLLARTPWTSGSGLETSYLLSLAPRGRSETFGSRPVPDCVLPPSPGSKCLAAAPASISPRQLLSRADTSSGGFAPRTQNQRGISP